MRSLEKKQPLSVTVTFNSGVIIDNSLDEGVDGLVERMLNLNGTDNIREEIKN